MDELEERIKKIEKKIDEFEEKYEKLLDKLLALKIKKLSKEFKSYKFTLFKSNGFYDYQNYVVLIEPSNFKENDKLITKISEIRTYLIENFQTLAVNFLNTEDLEMVYDKRNLVKINN